MFGEIKTQKGIALITAVFMLLALTVIGFVALNTSSIGFRITSNTRASKQAFYLAEAGAEVARELLRKKMASGSTLTAELNLVKGADGALANSNDISNFFNTDDLPFVNTTSLGTGSFKVYLTNDSLDGVTSPADTNGIVTLTSFGYGVDNSRAAVQLTVSKAAGLRLSSLPGAVSIAGPDTVFDAPNSEATQIDGGVSHPAVAVNSATSAATVTNSIQPQRYDHYTGTGGSPAVQHLAFDPPWGDIAQLQRLYTTLKNNADYTSPSDPGFTLGTSSDRKVVVIDGNFTMNSGAGAGILLVTGQLTLQGNFSYDGVVLVIGTGKIRREDGGNGTIQGGIYIANIKGSDGQINTADDAFGIPTLDTNGGGNSTIPYNLTSQTQSITLSNSFPFSKISWRQMGQ